ncbi:MAG TPA: hypothetical protein VJZ04_11305 [Lachnospiraceae bacterium]|nr:hypothetical protein [Lachnospiraceae bacterium]
MAISPIVLNGMIPGTQDYTTLKHNEINKAHVDQANFHQQFEKEVDSKLKQVHQKDNAEKDNRKFDARDKGNNEYSGDGGKKKKKEELVQDGKMVIKSNSHFDIQV